jgi:hypothetical protein
VIPITQYLIGAGYKLKVGVIFENECLMLNEEKIRLLFCQLLQNPVPASLVEKFSCMTPNEWDELALVAEHQLLTGILHHRLRILSGKFTLPENLRARLHQVYVETIATNMHIIRYTSQVLRALQARGLHVIGLKGIYLLDNVYENIGLRLLTDVDLLVRAGDLRAVIACLQDLGYDNKTWFDPQADNQDLMHVPPLKNKDGLMIELHWRISFEEDPFDFDIDGIWKRTIPAKIAGEEGLALSIEDLILHLCFHTAYHHVLLLGLRNLYDIREVIQHHQDHIDWSELIHLASEAGAERILALTLCLAESVLAFRIPDPTAARLAETVDPETLKQALNLLFYQPSAAYQVRTEHIAKFLSAKGIKDRVKLIRERFLLPKHEMARRYNVSPNSLRIYFYYPVRLVEFIIKNRGVVKGFLKRGVSQDQVDQGTGEFFIHKKQEQQLRDWMSSG